MRNFTAQVIRNQKIDAEVDGVIAAIAGMTPDEQSEVLVALASRAHETASSIQLLLLHKFQLVDDARSLLRVLIEHVIDAGVIAIGSEKLAARYVCFGDVEAAKLDKERREAFPEFPITMSPEHYEKARDEAVKRFPELDKARSWYRNLHDRAKLADESYGDRFFSYLYAMYQPLFAYVHGSSLSSALRIHEEGAYVGVGRRYGPDEAAEVMYGTTCTLITLGLVLDIFFINLEMPKHGLRGFRNYRKNRRCPILRALCEGWVIGRSPTACPPPPTLLLGPCIAFRQLIPRLRSHPTWTIHHLKRSAD